MSKTRKGVTTRTNADGTGYYDVFYRGTRTRLSTSKALADNAAWFEARATLLYEMRASGTFDPERAHVMLGVAHQRQKRTAQKVHVMVE